MLSLPREKSSTPEVFDTFAVRERKGDRTEGEHRTIHEQQ